MFRSLAARRVNNTNALFTSATRTYFYPGPGETGIYASSFRAFLRNMSIFAIASFPLMIWSVLGGQWNASRQFAPFSSDLHVSDGTVMEGEEAIANLKIQHERIMPFMEEIKAKLDAAQ